MTVCSMRVRRILYNYDLKKYTSGKEKERERETDFERFSTEVSGEEL